MSSLDANLNSVTDSEAEMRENTSQVLLVVLISVPHCLNRVIHSYVRL